ncbi:MAG: LuxR family transcriptional regulator [Desulfobacterales bacterium]|nr:LuxR family transcriptional regulator [Desulfobacterales bacterium]
MLSELSKHELKAILDISYKCLAVDCRGDVALVLDRLRELISFRAAAIAVKEKTKDAQIVLDWINHGFSPEWTKFYTDNNCCEVDPVIVCTKKDGYPFTWKEARLDAGKDDKKTMNFLHTAQDAGIYNGIAVSNHSKGPDSQEMIIAMDTGKEKTPGNWYIILHSVLPHIQEALKRIKTPKKETKNIRMELSEREVETLKWATEGKSSWEIGQIMGISERTIKFHFSNIFTKLNVVNRAQAVAIGISCGLI